MVQLQLQLEPNKQMTMTDAVRAIMLQSEWVTPYQLQRAIEQMTGTWHSDSAVTARLRELRRPEFGGYLIERRKRENARSFEYRLERVIL